MPDRYSLKCQEIWGGIEAVDLQVATPGLEGWIFCEPFENHDQGGDIHYISLCGHGKLTRFLIADVAGHGRTVSDLALEFRRLLHVYINTLDQTEFARNMNEEFGKLVKQGRFATSVVCTYFGVDDSLVTCNAGHPRPLWYRAESRTWGFLHEQATEVLDHVHDLPLGVISGTGYTQFAVKLNKDDLLIFYTDSLIEIWNSDNAILGEKGLLDLTRQIQPVEAEDVGRRLLEKVHRYSKADEWGDDVSLLVLHHTAEDSWDDI